MTDYNFFKSSTITYKTDKTFNVINEYTNEQELYNYKGTYSLDKNFILTMNNIYDDYPEDNYTEKNKINIINNDTFTILYSDLAKTINKDVDEYISDTPNDFVVNKFIGIGA